MGFGVVFFISMFWNEEERRFFVLFHSVIGTCSCLFYSIETSLTWRIYPVTSLNVCSEFVLSTDYMNRLSFKNHIRWSSLKINLFCKKIFFTFVKTKIYNINDNLKLVYTLFHMYSTCLKIVIIFYKPQRFSFCFVFI